jgi:microcin C transport system substrate-binding protein
MMMSVIGSLAGLSRRLLLVALLLPGLLLPASAREQNAPPDVTITKGWAVAEFGEPLYGPDMRHWRYVNPNAPKGGSITLGAFGSFDSLNPIILKGQKVIGLDLITESLMKGSGDEWFSAYGLIAESVEYPRDKSWAIFNLRPEARWHDGQPITAADFVFAWQALSKHGEPFLKFLLEEVAAVQALSPQRLKVHFKTADKIRSLIRVATMLVPQPAHWWTANGRDISKTTLEPPLASGPYRVMAINPGRSITYERVADYWARDLPVNVGRHNFDHIHYDYYRDEAVMFEAFKGGAYDLQWEYRARRWTTGYDDLPALKDGRLERRALVSERPGAANGIRFNTRRPQFADIRVRQALQYLYDAEWIQKNLLYGHYRRVKSYFPNSDFGASGPPTPEELAILEKYRGKVPEVVLTQVYEPPHTNGSGNLRDNYRRAMALFREAGWKIGDGRLVRIADGEPFHIEFLENNQYTVHLLQPYINNLKRAGIDARIRVVDSAQHVRRVRDFDFDAITGFSLLFPPPGAEQRNYFGSAAADIPGSKNWVGIKDPVVDALIDEITAAKDVAVLKATTRALDRVLLWGNYMVPQWYSDQVWLVYWTKFSWPAVKPKYDTGFPSTWWFDTGKTAQLVAR